MGLLIIQVRHRQAHQSVTTFIAPITINLITLNPAPKRELLINKLASRLIANNRIARDKHSIINWPSLSVTKKSVLLRWHLVLHLVLDGLQDDHLLRLSEHQIWKVNILSLSRYFFGLYIYLLHYILYLILCLFKEQAQTQTFNL